jgi:hypothetical protein
VQRGIGSTYYSFIQYLKKNRQKFAFLQLTGRMEDMLVKEFAYHIWRQSKGSWYPMTNVGKKDDRQKFDIAILRGTIGDTREESERSCKICGLVEAKYLQRRHRAWEGNANDETKGSLDGLRDQLGKFNSDRQYGFKVELQARNNDIYGLVIASYVSPTPDGIVRHKGDKKEFFGRIQEDARFRYLDMPKPYLNKVYDDVRIRLLKGERYCSLRAGLWKLAS